LRKTKPGKPLDPHGERGVVLCPNWRVPNLDSPADFALLRRLLLYWDVVVWPQFEIFRFDVDGATEMQRLIASEQANEPDVAFLVSEGALDLAFTITGTLPRLEAAPPTQAQLPALRWSWQETVYANCDYHEPGQWAMAQAKDDFRAPVDSAAGNEDGALGSLTNMCPEPAPGVTFPEILDFRRRNQGALQAFRFHLDELALTIQSNSSALSVNHAHARLDEDLAEIWRKSREQQFAASRISFGSVIAMVWEGTKAAVASAALAARVGYPLTTAAMIGAGIGAVAGAAGKPDGFTLSQTKLARLTGTPSYAAYLLAARDEGVIKVGKSQNPR
jgi:hypothetical protein